ncbi:hypothetical protein D3C75_936770 [compost metagenome]|uniref:Uncharacterized protein n=1 Tax=Paenibacillus jilunlii TaxID=682956 RepID=A0A1G9HC43_9BACL|nr:hypothetical protein [Paenibacillus jilunlii]KWX69612.1 hypothetical protein AML91_27795 [Paenibacillus jilunlii]SDL10284.1 hypothetical protein SAMN05216191_101785 [Paenibacillus jilunlii]
MAIYTIGAVSNLDPTLALISTFVQLRITNTTAARLEPIVVNAYSITDAGPEGLVETLYFTTTFAIAAPRGVVTLVIPTTVANYTITVSSPGAAGFVSDISLYAAGRDVNGFTVPEQTFPFGDWKEITTV